MTTFERIPQLIEFCKRLTHNFTEVNDNNVEYVRDNLIKVNNCRCLLMEDVGQLWIYPENDEQPVLGVRITEKIDVTLNYVEEEQEMGYGGVQPGKYRQYGKDVYIKTLKEMNCLKTPAFKVIVRAGMSKEISGQEK